MNKFQSQFGEKVRELGYHINESDEQATIFLHGEYVCSISRWFGVYRITSHAWMVPQEIADLIESYGDL